MLKKLTNTLKTLVSKDLSFKNVPVEDFRKRKWALESEEQRLEKDIRQTATERAILLEEYRLGNEAGDDCKKRLLARKIQDIDLKQKSLDMRHNHIAKQMRVTSGLLHLKETDTFMSRVAGGSNVLASMPLGEVEAFVYEATQSQELQQRDVDSLLETLESSMTTGELKDPTTDQFIAQLDAELDAQQGQSQAPIDQALDVVQNHIQQEINKPQATKPEASHV